MLTFSDDELKNNLISHFDTIRQLAFGKVNEVQILDDLLATRSVIRLSRDELEILYYRYSEMIRELK